MLFDNFFQGYSGQQEYIACQGPKEDTTYDFWRMIDQYDVKMIVMLTQLVERGKVKFQPLFFGGVVILNNQKINQRFFFILGKVSSVLSHDTRDFQLRKHLDKVHK